MVSFVPFLLLVVSLSGLDAIMRSPNIQVYSRHPPENGKPNFLNCYVSGFHPPQIEIELLKNGMKMKSEQSDLSFSKDWSFQVLAQTGFTPTANDEYVCRVTHEAFKEPKTVKWDRELN